MNKQKIITTSIIVLILLMSVSIASAGMFNNKKTIIIFPVKNNPTSPPAPAPTIVPVKVPSPAPVKAPFTISGGLFGGSSKSDVAISASSPNTVVISPAPLVVDVLITSTYSASVNGNLVILVTGLNGQALYLRNSRDITVKPGINAQHIIFESAGWKEGAYDVLVTFSTQKGETNTKNNVAEYEIRVPYIPESTPTPTPVPTPAPTPKPAPINTFDVTVTGKVPAQINVGQSLDILATVAHNRQKTVEDKLRITVTGAYPISTSDTVYSIQTYQQSKELIMEHHDTIISDESTWFNFNTAGWNPGIYHVMITFPVISGEINSANNIYETDVRVVGVKQPDITDVGLTAFNFELFYELPGVSDGTIVRGEDYYINYAIKNYGTQNEAPTFLITCEGATLYSTQVLLKAGETKVGKIRLDSSYIPFGGTIWRDGYSILIYKKHIIIGEVITPGDSNSANNKMNTYLIER